MEIEGRLRFRKEAYSDEYQMNYEAKNEAYLFAEENDFFLRETICSVQFQFRTVSR